MQRYDIRADKKTGVEGLWLRGQEPERRRFAEKGAIARIGCAHVDLFRLHINFAQKM